MTRRPRHRPPSDEVDIADHRRRWATLYSRASDERNSVVVVILDVMSLSITLTNWMFGLLLSWNFSWPCSSQESGAKRPAFHRPTVQYFQCLTAYLSFDGNVCNLIKKIDLTHLGTVNSTFAGQRPYDIPRSYLLPFTAIELDRNHGWFRRLHFLPCPIWE